MASVRSYFDNLLKIGNDLWICSYPLLAMLLLNVLYIIKFTTQGPELAQPIKNVSQRLGLITGYGDIAPSLLQTFGLLVLATLYCTIAVIVAGILALQKNAKKSGSTDVSDGRFEPGSTVPYWLGLLCLLSAVNAFLGVFEWRTLTIGGTLVFLAIPAVLPFVPIGWATAIADMEVLLWRLAFALIGIGAAIFVGIETNDVAFPRWLTTLPIIYFAFGFWSLAGTCLFIALPRRYRLPSMWLLPIVCGVCFSYFNDNHRVDLNHGTATGLIELRPTLNRWLAVHCPNRSPRVPCQLDIIAAQGGGLRAAFWTGEVLRQLDLKSNGRFSRHVFAASTISGGSLGAIAYYEAKGSSATLHDPEQSRALRRLLTDDYLSPVIGGLVFGNAFQWFLPFPIPALDRARAFEDGIRTTWLREFHNDDASKSFPPPLPNGPEFFLNSTNVESGQRFIISRLKMPPEDQFDARFAFDPKELYHISRMSTATAIHLSARFTFVSPAGTIYEWNAKDDREGRLWGRFVDGGYYDGSGLVTAVQIADAVCNDIRSAPEQSHLRSCDDFGTRSAPRQHVAVRIVYLSNDPNPRAETGLPDIQGPLSATVSTSGRVPPAGEISSVLEGYQNANAAIGISLARRCFESQYPDVADVMGSGDVQPPRCARLYTSWVISFQREATDGVGTGKIDPAWCRVQSWTPALGWWLSDESVEKLLGVIKIISAQPRSDSSSDGQMSPELLRRRAAERAAGCTVDRSSTGSTLGN